RGSSAGTVAGPARRRSPGRPMAKSGSGGPPELSPAPPPEKRTTGVLSEHYPDKGDYIEHRQFGVCRVEREDEAGGVLIRLPSGRRKTIKLEVMEILEPRIDGDKLIYPVRPKRR
ncbi:MAG: hypothetical protein ACFCGT_08370, partial [Sandaracinaceae bacterium]